MELVTFKTAELAKNKGFNAECSRYYKIDGEFLDDDADDSKYNWNSNNHSMLAQVLYEDSSVKINIISAPYQYELLDWLRKNHNLHIEILYDYENDSNSYHYTIRNIEQENGRKWILDYVTFEECVEEALQEALNLIK